MKKTNKKTAEKEVIYKTVVKWRWPDWYLFFWALIGMFATSAIITAWVSADSLRADGADQKAEFDELHNAPITEYGYLGFMPETYWDKDEVGPVLYSGDEAVARFVKRFGQSEDGYEVWCWILERKEDGRWSRDYSFRRFEAERHMIDKALEEQDDRYRIRSLENKVKQLEKNHSEDPLIVTPGEITIEMLELSTNTFHWYPADDDVVVWDYAVE